MGFELPHRQPESEDNPSDFRFSTEQLSTAELTALAPDEKQELMKETALEIMTLLGEAGGTEFSDVNELYAQLPNNDVVVRREDPNKIITSLATRVPYTISFPADSKYSNAILWRPEYHEKGIANAYLEGYGNRNGIVTIVGFVPESSMQIEKLPDASQVFAGLDRAHVYSVSGEVRPEDVSFVIVRIPITAFPSEFMTEDEEDLLFDFKTRQQAGLSAEPAFVQRGYLFNGKKNKSALLQ
jgi:hypothetical protein